MTLPHKKVKRNKEGKKQQRKVDEGLKRSWVQIPIQLPSSVCSSTLIFTLL